MNTGGSPPLSPRRKPRTPKVMRKEKTNNSPPKLSERTRGSPPPTPKRPVKKSPSKLRALNKLPPQASPMAGLKLPGRKRSPGSPKQSKLGNFSSKEQSGSKLSQGSPKLIKSHSMLEKSRNMNPLRPNQASPNIFKSPSQKKRSRNGNVPPTPKYALINPADFSPAPGAPVPRTPMRQKKRKGSKGKKGSKGSKGSKGKVRRKKLESSYNNVEITNPYYDMFKLDVLDMTKLAGSDLEQLLDFASDIVERRLINKDISSIESKLIALKKQAVAGDFRERRRHGLFGRKKERMETWASFKGMDKKTAIIQYIDLVKNLDVDYKRLEKFLQRKEVKKSNISSFANVAVMENFSDIDLSKESLFVSLTQVQLYDYDLVHTVDRKEYGINIDYHRSFFSLKEIQQFHELMRLKCRHLKKKFDIKQYTFDFGHVEQTGTVDILDVAPQNKVVFKSIYNFKDPVEVRLRKVLNEIASDLMRVAVDYSNPNFILDAFCSLDNTIELAEYLYLLVRYLDAWFNSAPGEFSVGFKTLFASFIYIRRARERGFQEKDFHFTVSKHNLHYLFASGFYIASMYLNEELVPLHFWAEASGLVAPQLTESSVLLQELLKRNFAISAEQFRQIYLEYNLRLE
eukprot:augustus_masked-scaffold_42-processed-gene-1.3-mRNA-1 protein AED:1.00 eAED:1.00 QI:0/-1/0/0/-1/1/1/0/627